MEGSSSSSSSSSSHLPKEAKVMESIVKSAGVTQFEPRVITQLLELSYRWERRELTLSGCDGGVRQVRQPGAGGGQAAVPARPEEEYWCERRETGRCPGEGEELGPPPRQTAPLPAGRQQEQDGPAGAGCEARSEAPAWQVLSHRPELQVRLPRTPTGLYPLCCRLRKRRKVALVKNCSVISAPASPLPEENLEPESVEPPLFTIEYDLNQNNGFTFQNFSGENWVSC